MTRRAPSILGAFPSAEGGVEVFWEVDSFFADSEAPDRIFTYVNGGPLESLDGDETSVEVPAELIAELRVAALLVEIVFAWDAPADLRSSSIPVPIGGGPPVDGHQGVFPAKKPVVTLNRVSPRTAASRGVIEIAWSSDNYNDGNIHWGPAGRAPTFHKSIKPRGTVYSGTFVTDQKLVAATQYAFTVEVRNTLHSPTWLATAIVVRSAPDTLSLRAFLVGSGRAVTTPVSMVVGPDRSLHTLLVG